MRVQCPGCGKQLVCDPGPSGKRIACPACRHVFSVRPPEEGFTAVLPMAKRAEEEVLDVLPAGPLAVAYHFASEQGLDLGEVFERQVEDEAEATKLLQDWQQQMPEVPSAYQPSGVLPASAVMWMSLGSLVGGVAGFLAGGVVAAIGGALAALVGYFIALLLFCGLIWYFSIFIAIVVVVGGVAATFFIMGAVASTCTTSFGRRGKNRNVRAAVFFSLMSSLLAVVLFGELYVAVGKGMLVERGWGDYADYLALGVAVLGGTMALFTAGSTAAATVAEAKFCEDCECYETETSLKKLCLGGLHVLVRALAERRWDVACSVLHAADGEDGEVKLFACPGCSQGYLEATATFKAEWKEKKDKKEKEKTWRVASQELPAEEAKRLQENVVDAKAE